MESVRDERNSEDNGKSPPPDEMSSSGGFSSAPSSDAQSPKRLPIRPKPAGYVRSQSITCMLSTLSVKGSSVEAAEAAAEASSDKESASGRPATPMSEDHDTAMNDADPPPFAQTSERPTGSESEDEAELPDASALFEPKSVWMSGKNVMVQEDAHEDDDGDAQRGGAYTCNSFSLQRLNYNGATGKAQSFTESRGRAPRFIRLKSFGAARQDERGAFDAEPAKTIVRELRGSQLEAGAEAVSEQENEARWHVTSQGPSNPQEVEDTQQHVLSQQARDVKTPENSLGSHHNAAEMLPANSAPVSAGSDLPYGGKKIRQIRTKTTLARMSNIGNIVGMFQERVLQSLDDEGGKLEVCMVFLRLRVRVHV
jgi:hypothetical protein